MCYELGQLEKRRYFDGLGGLVANSSLEINISRANILCITISKIIFTLLFPVHTWNSYTSIAAKCARSTNHLKFSLFRFGFDPSPHSQCTVGGGRGAWVELSSAFKSHNINRLILIGLDCCIPQRRTKISIKRWWVRNYYAWRDANVWILLNPQRNQFTCRDWTRSPKCSALYRNFFQCTV